MFTKGQSGNPSGRPKIPEEIKDRLKREYVTAVQFWIDTLHDTEARWEHRSKSAEMIANYAYGKPKEIVDLDVSGRIEGITVEIVDKATDATIQ